MGLRGLGFRGLGSRLEVLIRDFLNRKNICGVDLEFLLGNLFKVPVGLEEKTEGTASSATAILGTGALINYPRKKRPCRILLWVP